MLCDFNLWRSDIGTEYECCHILMIVVVDRPALVWPTVYSVTRRIALCTYDWRLLCNCHSTSIIYAFRPVALFSSVFHDVGLFIIVHLNDNSVSSRRQSPRYVFLCRGICSSRNTVCRLFFVALLSIICLPTLIMIYRCNDLMSYVGRIFLWFVFCNIWPKFCCWTELTVAGNLVWLTCERIDVVMYICWTIRFAHVFSDKSNMWSDGQFVTDCHSFVSSCLWHLHAILVLRTINKILHFIRD